MAKTKHKAKQIHTHKTKHKKTKQIKTIMNSLSESKHMKNISRTILLGYTKFTALHCIYMILTFNRLQDDKYYKLQ